MQTQNYKSSIITNRCMPQEINSYKINIIILYIVY